MVSSGVEALGNGGAQYSVVDDGAFGPQNAIKSTFGSRNSTLLKAIMIASGGLSGGLSSAIAGGSFWKGVREGLITSGLNHAMHSVVDGGGDLDANDEQNTGTGEKHILFDDNEGNKSLIEASKNTFTPANTIDLYGHGFEWAIEGLFGDGLHNYLMNNSEYYKFSIKNNSYVKIRIFSCLTGKGTDSLGHSLSLKNKNAQIISPSTYIGPYKGQFAIRSTGKWYDFRNGVKTISDFNNTFSRKVYLTAKNYETKKYQKYLYYY